MGQVEAGSDDELSKGLDGLAEAAALVALSNGRDVADGARKLLAQEAEVHHPVHVRMVEAGVERHLGPDRREHAGLEARVRGHAAYRARIEPAAKPPRVEAST